MKRPHRILIGTLAVTALFATMLAAIPAAFAADTFPSKPIRLLTPYGLSGVGGQTARIAADKLSSLIGQKVVDEHFDTAGIPAVADMVLKATADGYTIFHGGIGVAINALMVKNLPYDVIKDFTPISTLAAYDLVICVSPESRFGSLTQLLEAAKANPGKFKLGTSGVGSTQQLSAELFKSIAGIDIEIVPQYRNVPDLMKALRSGAVDVAFELVPGLLPEIKAKTVRLLANAASKRYAGLPDVPTTAEAGLPTFQVSGWNALSVRTGTPQTIVDQLNKAVVAALKSPDVTQQMRAIGAEPWPSTAKEAGQIMTAETTRWKEVIERAKIPKQ